MYRMRRLLPLGPPNNAIHETFKSGLNRYPDLTHLHVSNGFDCVLIVVDHLTQMAHFRPCTKSVTKKESTNLFLHGVYRLHGLTRVLVTHRDPKFVSGFGQTLCRLLELASRCLVLMYKVAICHPST
jgi:hypothetical protein